MASEIDIAQVCKGMQVYTADGHTLGKVAQVWYGTDPTAGSPRCDEDTCSRLEVHHRSVFKRSVLYVPSSAIGAIAAGRVTLNLDAATANERVWIKPPGWIAAAGADLRPDLADDKYKATAANSLGPPPMMTGGG